MSPGPRRIPNLLFLERLRSEMAIAGLGNGNQLANAVGVSRDTAGAWLAGDSDPSGPNLGNLADYFGCTMDYLWGRVEGRTEVYYRLPGRLVKAVDQIMRAAMDLEEFSSQDTVVIVGGRHDRAELTPEQEAAQAAAEVAEEGP